MVSKTGGRSYSGEEESIVAVWLKGGRVIEWELASKAQSKGVLEKISGDYPWSIETQKYPKF